MDIQHETLYHIEVLRRERFEKRATWTHVGSDSAAKVQTPYRSERLARAAARRLLLDHTWGFTQAVRIIEERVTRRAAIIAEIAR